MAQIALKDQPYRRPRRGVRGVLREMRREWTAYLFNAPGMLLFAVFTAYALYTSFTLSFHEWNILEPAKPFVGHENNRQVAQDARKRDSIGKSN
jgi:multiple sugar transport system permease protein